MPSINTISVEKLARLIGTPKSPVVVDVRSDEDYATDPRLIPGSMRRATADMSQWARNLLGCTVIVLCRDGHSLSPGAAAWLRQAGASADHLEGGFDAWKAARQLLIEADKLPRRDALGRTVWVTRSRPKVDRIACPWLIRRFVDPAAVFLFVAPGEIPAVADRFGAAPFDTEGVFWSHRGDRCTFDVMLEELGLNTEPLLRLANIVRGADTARLDLAPEAPGLLAVSLGLSRMYADDIEQLEAGLLIYDGFYRWCRDASDETHNWPTNKPVA